MLESPVRRPAAGVLSSAGLLASLLLAGCDGSTTAPSGAAGPHTAAVASSGLTIYTDRAAWEAAVTAAGGSAQLFDFTGLTTGRITATPTNYGPFSISVDRLSSSSSFNNPGIDIVPDASCSLGTGDCDVFTFNMQDPSANVPGADAPTIDNLIMPQPIMAFGGDFVQLGVAVGGGPAVPTGPVTLHFGSETAVLTDYVDPSTGFGFIGFVATTPATTLSFTFAQSGTIINEIFQIFNPAFANGAASATPAQKLADLRAIVAGLSAPSGTASGLDAKLRAAATALGAGQTATACSALQDFIQLAKAQSGKKLAASDAATLIAKASDIRTALGC